MTGGYRDFPFPLNTFMHVLTLEEGEARYLHYGLFELLGLSGEQVDGLIESGEGYVDLYRSGCYGYRLLSFHA